MHKAELRWWEDKKLSGVFRALKENADEETGRISKWVRVHAAKLHYARTIWK